MIETSKSKIERWKGLSANIAPCLQKEGEFFRVEGVTNLAYGVERAKGKRLMLVVGATIWNLCQIGKVLIMQVGETIEFHPITEFIIPEENLVTVGGLQVTQDGLDIYAGT